MMLQHLFSGNKCRSSYIYHNTRSILTVVEPKVKGFICTTAHPVGCDVNVCNQIDFIKSKKNELLLNDNNNKPKNVLVIGSSTGYGLASRITSAFGYNASTIGVFFEKASIGKRTGSSGWYNTAAFQKYAQNDGIYSKNINGNAFGYNIKNKTIDLIKSDLGKIDLVIYSLASARRQDPDNNNIIYQSVLKPIARNIINIGLDTDREIIREYNINCANDDEINNTIAVMGGNDWQLWINKLYEANVLSDNCLTTAYTYIGSNVTSDIYWNGTIGAAKKDLDNTVNIINNKYNNININASVSVLKAVVTQASSAIPTMPLYLTLLFRVMKDNNINNEDCIQQIYRLYSECLYNNNPRIDDNNRYRVDDKELLPEIQNKVEELLKIVNTDNFKSLGDFAGYKNAFYQLFGFNVNGVNYSENVETEININNLYDEIVNEKSK